MHKGTPQHSRNRAWHIKHMKKLKKREMIRKAHAEYIPTRIIAHKQKPIGLWARIKLFFKRKIDN